MCGRRKWRGWYLLLALIGLPDVSAAAIIYRFGGEGFPPPPEADRPEVEFRQMAWQVEASAAGDSSKIQEEEGAIGPIPDTQWYDITPYYLGLDSGLGALFDGDVESFWWAPNYLCGSLCDSNYGRQGIINLDLGDNLPVSRIVLVSGGPLILLGNPNGVRDLGVSLSASNLRGAGDPLIPFMVEIHSNRNPALNIPIPPGQRARSVQIALAEHSNPWQIFEIQIYIRKAARLASYTSKIIDFGQPAVWGAMRWSLRQAAESSVSLQTRNGENLDLFRFWRYTGIGDQRLEVTRAEYDKLRTGEKADSTYNYGGWNPWTARSNLANERREPPIFPWPRRTFQFQVEFFSLGEEGSQVEFLEFRASVPAVSEIVGELDPIQVEAGALTRFTYTLKPRLRNNDTGFDRLEIRAAAARLSSVQRVYIDGVEVPFATEERADRRLVLSFPRIGQSHSDSIIEVVFEAQVLRYGGAFTGRIIDSRRPFDTPQPVLAGNALDEVDSDRVWIETTIEVKSVLVAQVVAATFTPNGDGINDQGHIMYNLVETTGGVPVEVEIRDLAGRRVRRVHAGVESIGRYEHPWDGRDEEGRRVPPGIYIYRVIADIASERFAQVGTLRVVY
jgi:hypothetical protein